MNGKKGKECPGSQWRKLEKTNCALSRKVKIYLGIKLYIFPFIYTSKNPFKK